MKCLIKTNFTWFFFLNKAIIKSKITFVAHVIFGLSTTAVNDKKKTLVYLLEFHSVSSHFPAA